MEKKLIVILGPTGVGKTAYAINEAQRIGCEIINADSRQVFKEIPIGTAAPTIVEQSLVRHHFVGCKSITESYNAAEYERDVLELLPRLWQLSDTVIMAGGSMMYIDAVCHGIDIMPDIPAELRAEIKAQISTEGLVGLLEELKTVDPEYYSIVDKRNPVRVQRAIELYRLTGKPYSTFRKGRNRQRRFKIEKIGLSMNRELLCERINKRVEQMIETGLIEEARSVYHLRGLQSLNTVGFKELFKYFDGEWDLSTAVARIQKNTRLYAKKQMTWFRRDQEINWVEL